MEERRGDLIEKLSRYSPTQTEETQETRSQDMWCHSRGPSREPSKYKSTTLPLDQPARSFSLSTQVTWRKLFVFLRHETLLSSLSFRTFWIMVAIRQRSISTSVLLPLNQICLIHKMRYLTFYEDIAMQVESSCCKRQESLCDVTSVYL